MPFLPFLQSVIPVYYPQCDNAKEQGPDHACLVKDAAAKGNIIDSECKTIGKM